MNLCVDNDMNLPVVQKMMSHLKHDICEYTVIIAAVHWLMKFYIRNSGQRFRCFSNHQYAICHKTSFGFFNVVVQFLPEIMRKTAMFRASSANGAEKVVFGISNYSIGQKYCRRCEVYMYNNAYFVHAVDPS